MRNNHRVGDYLVMSDISGRVFYASEMRKTWDGRICHWTEWEPRHPQDFVRARKEAPAPRTVRPRPSVEPGFPELLVFVGDTNVPAPVGPATHLFDVGIGEMIIEGTFVVR